MQAKVHHHERRDERAQAQVDQRQDPHPGLQRPDVVKVGADPEIVVEHVREHGVGDVPLHRLGQPRLPPQAGNVERQTQHAAVKHAQEVILPA
jgi:hypothetical protein